MPLPVIIGGVIAGAVASLQSMSTFIGSTIMAYFVVLGILVLDSGQASLLGNAGAVGGFLSFVINGMTGFNFAFETWQLLFIFAIFPFFLFFVKMGNG